MLGGNPSHRRGVAPNCYKTQRRFNGNIPVKGTEFVNAADGMAAWRVHAQKNPLQDDAGTASTSKQIESFGRGECSCQHTSHYLPSSELHMSFTQPLR